MSTHSRASSRENNRRCSARNSTSATPARIGQTHPDTTSTNPVNPENPANPERESDRPEPDNAGLTEFSGCTGLHETPRSPNQPGDADPQGLSPADDPADIGDFDTLRAKLLAKLNAPGPQTASGNGEHRAPVLESDTNPIPPGGWTSSTPGLTERVQTALASARTNTASTVINGQATGADLTVERHLDGPNQEGKQHG
jgi:hypothetical protein